MGAVEGSSPSALRSITALPLIGRVRLARDRTPPIWLWTVTVTIPTVLSSRNRFRHLLDKSALRTK